MTIPPLPRRRALLQGWLLGAAAAAAAMAQGGGAGAQTAPAVAPPGAAPPQPGPTLAALTARANAGTVGVISGGVDRT